MLRRLLPLTVVLPLVAGCAAAGPSGGGSGSGSGGQDAAVSVVAAFYPLEHVVRQVGGDRVAVEGLTPPGAEPHDLELGARQTARVVDSDLLVSLAGFQPAVDAAAEQVGDRTIDVASVVELLEGGPGGGHDGHDGHEGETAEEHAEHADEHADGAADPHLWLDPLRYAEVGDAVAERLAELDPEGADAYATGAAAFRRDLEALDAELTAGLADCERRELVVSHEAFGYLADRYDLEQVGIAGLSPDAEPSPGRLAEAARFARAHDVTTIFFETLVSPDVAETVAAEVGADTAVLDPLEGPPAEGDYLTAMRANLAALQAGLGCS